MKTQQIKLVLITFVGILLATVIVSSVIVSMRSDDVDVMVQNNKMGFIIFCTCCLAGIFVFLKCRYTTYLKNKNIAKDLKEGKREWHVCEIIPDMHYFAAPLLPDKMNEFGVKEYIPSNEGKIKELLSKNGISNRSMVELALSFC